MTESRIKTTPIKFIFELLRLSPRQVLKVIFGNKLLLIDDAQVIGLLSEGYSLARWADGETAIARNKSIGYQTADPRLASKLNSLLTEKSNTLIMGFPSAITENLMYSDWNLRRLQILLSTRIYLSKISNTKYQFLCDTFFWYRNFRDLQKILSRVTQNRRTVLVASNEKYLNFAPAGTKFIGTKASDSFMDYENLSSQIKNHINSSTIPVTILCACGPTSKALVYDFKDFAQVIDVGHGFTFANSGKKKYAWDI